MKQEPKITIINSRDLRLGNTAEEAADHPHLHACIMASTGGHEVGRLNVYINKHLRQENRPMLLIGNLECVDDQLVFDAMISHCIKIAGDIGAASIAGPVDGSTWDAYRLPLSSEKAFTGDLASPSYYSNLFTRAGFAVAHTYYSSQALLTVASGSGAEPVFPNQQVTIRPINLSAFDQELSDIYPLCIEAFAGNPLFSPITKSAFISRYRNLMPCIDPQFVLLAVHQGCVIAFVFCYPDIADRHNPRLIVKTIARHPQHRLAGLITTMIDVIYYRAYHAGYTQVIHAFMHQSNKSLALSDRYHGKVIREYRLYQKPIV